MYYMDKETIKNVKELENLIDSQLLHKSNNRLRLGLKVSQTYPLQIINIFLKKDVLKRSYIFLKIRMY